MRIKVDNHVTGVPERLREIDPDLSVYFNAVTQRFEVVGRDKRGPYVLGEWPELDNRVVAEVRQGYWVLNHQRKPWRTLLDKLRRDRDRMLEEDDRRFAERQADDFRWFGRDLYPGFTPKEQVAT